MYKGELLPGNASDAWFYQKSIYFKKLYLQTIQELEKVFLQKKDHKSRLFLYSRAAAIYPFEGWQLHMMRCNLEMYRYREALNVYNSTMELYAQEMGSPPAAEMQECFEQLKWMDEDHRKAIDGLDGWRELDRIFMGKKEDIRRAIFGEDTEKGAYYCTYPSFVDYCRLVARTMRRHRFPAVLLFVTLSRSEKQENRKPMDLQEQMLLLKAAIGGSLRVGDAYTRYGNRHFILMLEKTEMDSCSTIFRRIEKAYVKMSGKGELWYHADMTQELNQAVFDSENEC